MSLSANVHCDPEEFVGVFVGTRGLPTGRCTNMPLTELQIRSAKPQAKVAKLSDGGGLQLWVTPDGAKRWRLAYRFAGGQKLLAIGVYPAVGLKDARIARERARRLLSGGADPSDAKKQAKIERANASENSFASIATELIDKKRREGKAGVTVGKAEWLLRFCFARTRQPSGKRHYGARHPGGSAKGRVARQAGNSQTSSRDHRTGLPLCGRDRAGG